MNNNFDYFYSKTTSSVESHVPKKRVSRRGLKLKSKPWIGSKIQKLMYLRDKLFNKANKSPTSSNKYLHRKFRNRVVAEQRQSRVKYFQNYFEKYKTNMKMLWGGIRSIVNVKKNSNTSHISHLLITILVYQYFVNVCTKVDKSIPRTKKSPLSYLKNRNSDLLFLAPVTPNETEIIINSLNKNKSTGPYSIPVVLLKILSSYIACSLATIVNHSFEYGIFFRIT